MRAQRGGRRAGWKGRSGADAAERGGGGVEQMRRSGAEAEWSRCGGAGRRRSGRCGGAGRRRSGADAAERGEAGWNGRERERPPLSAASHPVEPHALPKRHHAPSLDFFLGLQANNVQSGRNALPGSRAPVPFEGGLLHAHTEHPPPQHIENLCFRVGG